MLHPVYPVVDVLCRPNGVRNSRVDTGERRVLADFVEKAGQ
jgi:hypothetical protein